MKKIATKDRLAEVFKYASDNTPQKAAEYFSISLETITRYIRAYKAPISPEETLRDVNIKVLVFDVETAPTASLIWRFWKQNISRNQILKDGFIISYTAKWLHSGEVMADALPFYKKAYKENPQNDFFVVKSLVELLNAADIVIAHNGKKFDIPMTRTRALFHKMKPFSPVKIIDTLLIARSLFDFPHNSLDALADYLGIGRKVSHEGFDLWKKVYFGDPEAWKKMIIYNEGDTTLLEKVYLALRAWDNKHPNISVYATDGIKRCNCCGSPDLQEDKFVSTNLSAFESYQCNNCGHWNRGRRNMKTKEQMKATLTNVAY